MIPYRILTLLAWAVVAVFMAKGAWASASGRGARYGDAMRLACFATACVMLGWNAKWFVAADNMIVWKMLQALSVADAGFIVVLGVRYGRGPKL
jgi:hypothetical protein